MSVPAESQVRPDSREPGHGLAVRRLMVGFLQGIAAWLLLRVVSPEPYSAAGKAASHTLYWSDRHPVLFAAATLVTAFIPVIYITEAGRMRRRALVTYMGLAAATLLGLAAYDLWRDPLEYFGTVVHARVWPSFTLCLCVAMGLFIANQLLEHRERGYSLWDGYAEHFEDSWMRGFQLVVSLIFALLVWGVLNLGAELFGLIHISAIRTLIDHNWFRSPALAMAFAASVHLTDVRPSLLRGVRNVGLTLLSWLLPLVVVLGASFLVTLVFVGLRPLWNTRHAASILLWACAIALVLLNAAYKDGDASNVPPAVLRWAGRVAGPTMLLLALLAFYAIVLRVQQYGWTPDRVRSAVVALIAIVYGAGYTYAALRSGAWLLAVQKVNVGASLAIIAILTLLLTPLADPGRISVESQMSRLASGRQPPGKFDYQFLRFDSGQYGTRALAQLAASADTGVRSRAKLMQEATKRDYMRRGVPDPAETEPRLSHAAIYPDGAQLPPDFHPSEDDVNGLSSIDCLKNGSPCDIYIVPYGAKGDVAVIVRSYDPNAATDTLPFAVMPGRLYQRDPAGAWVRTGQFDHTNCPAVIAALRAGNIESVPPGHDDLVVAGVRLRFTDTRENEHGCAGHPRPAPGDPKPPGDPRAPAHMGPAFGGQG